MRCWMHTRLALLWWRTVCRNFSPCAARVPTVHLQARRSVRWGHPYAWQNSSCCDIRLVQVGDISKVTLRVEPFECRSTKTKLGNELASAVPVRLPSPTLFHPSDPLATSPSCAWAGCAESRITNTVVLYAVPRGAFIPGRRIPSIRSFGAILPEPSTAESKRNLYTRDMTSMTLRCINVDYALHYITVDIIKVACGYREGLKTYSMHNHES
ncbi:uncharacterized protein B0H18DRAFT_19907 [Fomitopsis serialis]|uniref:uncharacterized protein n=1 Tax=Fomitopsis serialis TaxID=139415 RepID=UPI002007A15E|nr:uncharacterized protein B0H18DRAFT_19907 [Neoantrodia serialis]KAH9938581.1 hypothetical protein B0H18DRAFT_19907 [Neoantrodia serialis]